MRKYALVLATVAALVGAGAGAAVTRMVLHTPEHRPGRYETEAGSTNDAEEQVHFRNMNRASDWTCNGVEMRSSEADLTLVASKKGKWLGAYIDFDVSGVSYVTVSCAGFEPASDVPEDFKYKDKIRYGEVSGIRVSEDTEDDGGPAVEWIGFLNRLPQVIDVSAMDTLRLALYVTTGAEVPAGVSEVFSKLLVERGRITGHFDSSDDYPAVYDLARRDHGGGLESLSETGGISYYGEQISLSPGERRCGFRVFKSFSVLTDPDLVSFGLNQNQSMAVAGEKIFLFQSGGGVVVIDGESREIEAVSTLPRTHDQHSGAAQFTDIYFHQGDEYPLIALSRCSNSGALEPSGDPSLDALQFYRVLKNENSYEFILVNQVVLDVKTCGSCWGVDNDAGFLYQASTENGGWQIKENNPVIFRTFEMPSKKEILSGETIVLTADDASARMEMPFTTIQDMEVKDGIAYVGVTVPDRRGAEMQRLYAVDVFANVVRSDVPLGIKKETEGVAFYGDSILVSFRNYSDKEGKNPLIIGSFTF